MLNQMTFLDIPSATFLPALEAGHEHSASPGGRTIDRSGQAPVHASRSASPGQEKAPMTTATYGPSFSNSSASAALRSCLANKLRQRLRLDGSMEYALTLRERVTPAGRRIFAVRASARRTSGKDCTGWPTPDTNKRGGAQDPEKRKAGGHSVTLQDAATLVSPWATSSSRDYKDTPGMATIGLNPDGSTRKRTDQLPRQAALTSGVDTSSSPAETVNTDESSQASRRSSGSLNPALPRWLMGYPVEWCEAAIAAYRKIKAVPRK